MVSLSYLANKTTHVWIGEDINPAVYIPGKSTTGNTNQRTAARTFRTPLPAPLTRASCNPTRARIPITTACSSRCSTGSRRTSRCCSTTPGPTASAMAISAANSPETTIRIRTTARQSGRLQLRCPPPVEHLAGRPQPVQGPQRQGPPAGRMADRADPVDRQRHRDQYHLGQGQFARRNQCGPSGL